MERFAFSRLDWSSKYFESQLFLQFLWLLKIKAKPKQFCTLQLENNFRKIQNSKGFIVLILWVGDARNIHKSFFIKNHYWNLKLFKWFFQVLWSVLLKNEKRITKTMRTTWKITTITFFLSFFVNGTGYILLENILWENVIYIITFLVSCLVLQNI